MEEKKKKPPLTPKEAKLKAANFCAYQERSQKEVRNKLYEYGLYTDEVDEVLAELITDGFINEERFAKSYAGGKFRMKKWGRNRIKMHLQQHNISEYCIKKGLLEIDNSDYRNTLELLILNKSESLSEANLFAKRDKIAKHVIFKGYESEIVWEMVKDLVI
ncbi:MAG: RecX family transcriptional regulator [Reichenbachiella sp.]